MSILINDPVLADVWKYLCAEYEEANRKHPNYPKDALRRTAIMCEEAGEALQAALDLTRGADHGHHDLARADDRLFNETIQTGAMAIALLVAMINDRRVKREKILS